MVELHVGAGDAHGMRSAGPDTLSPGKIGSTHPMTVVMMSSSMRRTRWLFQSNSGAVGREPDVHRPVELGVEAIQPVAVEAEHAALARPRARVATSVLARRGLAIDVVTTIDQKRRQRDPTPDGFHGT